MTRDPRYWIWLQLALGYQFDVKELINYFGSAQAVYNSSLKERAMCELLNKKKIEDLVQEFERVFQIAETEAE